MTMETFETDTHRENDTAALVRGRLEVLWNHGRLEAVEDFFGDEFSNFGRRGPDAHALIRAIVTAWRSAFPTCNTRSTTRSSAATPWSTGSR
ncbi:hypothetical protein LQ327_09590 [Actinomycetospora endophytica]|uniref:SnoaL-like protein n=1 Tax=Actinomycetospora endophytica TaxID=2291215 RepID=A0ABS8P6H3_9PSEU|nr:hypothetical protein [Actinomycetospora endophytica]MCD2193633.1 hypothetical protein [Actinomycetospora endophytica]